MNAGGNENRALAVAAALLSMAGVTQAQTAARVGPAPRPPPPWARPAPPLQPGGRTARSPEMNMTSYDIMMPGPDMPPELRRKMKVRR